MQLSTQDASARITHRSARGYLLASPVSPGAAAGHAHLPMSMRRRVAIWHLQLRRRGQRAQTSAVALMSHCAQYWPTSDSDSESESPVGRARSRFVHWLICRFVCSFVRARHLLHLLRVSARRRSQVRLSSWRLMAVSGASARPQLRRRLPYKSRTGRWRQAPVPATSPRTGRH